MMNWDWACFPLTSLAQSDLEMDGALVFSVSPVVHSLCFKSVVLRALLFRLWWEVACSDTCRTIVGWTSICFSMLLLCCWGCFVRSCRSASQVDNIGTTTNSELWFWTKVYIVLRWSRAGFVGGRTPPVTWVLVQDSSCESCLIHRPYTFSYSWFRISTLIGSSYKHNFCSYPTFPHL